MTGAGAPHVDVAILTALAVEEAAVVEAIGNCLAYRWRSMSLQLADTAGQQVLVVPIGGVGNTKYVVDARGAEGVQAGDGNVQRNVFSGLSADR